MAGAAVRPQQDDARLRALAFWTGHHQAHQPAPRLAPVIAAEQAARDEARVARIGELARMVPELKKMADDPRPQVRATVARCFAILATARQLVADREIWRILLGLSKYDADPAVRASAEAALVALERHGTVAAKAS